MFAKQAQASCCARLVVGRLRGRDHSEASVVLFDVYIVLFTKKIQQKSASISGATFRRRCSRLLVRKSNTMPENWNTRACQSCAACEVARVPFFLGVVRHNAGGHVRDNCA